MHITYNIQKLFRANVLLIILASGLTGCGNTEDSKAFKDGTTMVELKAKSAKIAASQAAEQADKERASSPKTELSGKARLLQGGMKRDDVFKALGLPSHVIAPSRLKVNNIDRSSDIEYVVTWDNPGCSRVEVFFNSSNRVSGWDSGELCKYPMKPLGTSYSCDNTANAKYCKVSGSAVSTNATAN